MLPPGTPVDIGTIFITASVTKPLVVGLTVHPTRLVQIRRNRLLMLREDAQTPYVDNERVEREVVEARRYFLSKNWPVIDVTRRSIEETAAAIIQLHEHRIEQRTEGQAP